MQFTSTLVALAALATNSIVSAFCYDEGEGSQSVNNLKQVEGAIEDLCGKGLLAGYFNEGQSKQFCIPVSDGNIHFDLQTVWLGRGGLTLNNNDCAFQLDDVLFQCSGRGGDNVQYDWYFRVDPNSGGC